VGYYNEEFHRQWIKEGITVDFSANPYLYVSGFKFDKTFIYKIEVVVPQND